MIHARLVALPIALLALAGSVSATPPKPRIEGGAGVAGGSQEKGEEVGADEIKSRNAMALRGGVPEDIWLEALHRLTRVPTPRREEVTRAVRTYIVDATAWRESMAPRLKTLTARLVEIRDAGEPVPRDLSKEIREIRQAMPRLSDLQARVWELLNSPEQGRLVDEVAELKRTGLPKDIVDGRRAPGTPARVTRKSTAETGANDDSPAPEPADAEVAENSAPLLWSFVDDPNPGQPLPEPVTDDGDSASTRPPSR